MANLKIPRGIFSERYILKAPCLDFSWSSQFSIYIYDPNLSKIYLVTIFCSPLRTSCITLSCKTCNISNLSMLVYYNSFFSEKSLTYALPGLFSSLTFIKVLNVFQHNFFIFKFSVSYCSLTFKYSSSEGLFGIYGTIVSRYVLFLVGFLINISSTALVLHALIVLRAPRVVSEEYLVFYFLFSQFPTMISTMFFLKFVIYMLISEVRLHFQCYGKP